MLPNKEVFARHLSEMAQFPTISHVNDDETDFEPFYAFHKYLEETYPLVHKTFTREVVGKAALLYHWESKKNSGKLPILLAAHQDVVPEGDHAGWRYPPYAGNIAENCIWGRGVLDCKSMVMGEMEALEALIADGYEPEQDIFLAYGYNEEVGLTAENPSAHLMCKQLQERGIRLGLVIDEGGEIAIGSDGLQANIAVAEKGFASIVLYKNGEPGHPARPGKNCIMADVARAVVEIADYPRPYRVTVPMDTQYKSLASFKKGERLYYENLKDHMDWLTPRLEVDPRVSAKFQTTLAMTMAQGSPTTSSLPAKVSVHMNLRLLEGDTVENMISAFRGIAAKYGAAIDIISARNPSPASIIDMEIFEKISIALKEIHDDIRVVPDICVGGTDAFYYSPICNRVYRFSGGRRHPDNGPSHGFNEKYSVETVDDIPKFFYRFLRQW